VRKISVLQCGKGLKIPKNVLYKHHNEQTARNPLPPWELIFSGIPGERSSEGRVVPRESSGRKNASSLEEKRQQKAERQQEDLCRPEPEEVVQVVTPCGQSRGTEVQKAGGHHQPARSNARYDN
jgi:hypothetical protein